MIRGALTGLRAIEVEDLIHLRDWRNIPNFRRNFREVRELNMENQRAWLSKTNSNQNDFMFGIVKLDSNELIGAAGLLYINWVIRSADFSFYIGKDELYIDNEGFAFDSASTLISYGFNNLNLNKIWMELYEYDSRKIEFFTQKLGFRVDGTLRENCFEDGRYWNSYIISLLRSEYKKGK